MSIAVLENKTKKNRIKDLSHPVTRVAILQTKNDSKMGREIENRKKKKELNKKIGKEHLSVNK